MAAHLIYFRPDLTEYITQEFVEKYSVSTEAWLKPQGYYLQNKETVGSDRGIPDGAYVMLGHIDYTSCAGTHKHKIGQFTGVKVEGINFVISHSFNYYPNSKDLDLNPMFAMVRVGVTSEFKKVGIIVEDLKTKPVTEMYLLQQVLHFPPNSVESKVYRLRLALQRQMV